MPDNGTYEMERATARRYEARVQSHQPAGYSRYWLGCTARVGNTRMTVVCRHFHDNEADAILCAERLTQSPNRRVPGGDR